MSKKGFTFIELIIVLAILALIALLAMPNFLAEIRGTDVKAQIQQMSEIEKENKTLQLEGEELMVGETQYTLNVCEPKAVRLYIKLWGENAIPTRDLQDLVIEDDSEFINNLLQKYVESGYNEETVDAIPDAELISGNC